MGLIAAHFSFSFSLLRFAAGGLILATVLFTGLFLWARVLANQDADLIAAHGDAFASRDDALMAQNSTESLVDHLRAHSLSVVVGVGAAFAAFYIGAVLIFGYEENRRRRLEQRITSAQRNEHLGLLAAGAAHDFNNMLMAIAGNAALSKRQTSSDSPVREYLDDIEFTVQRASELTRQLQHYAGGGDQVIEPVSLNSLVTDTVRVLRPTFGDGIIVEIATEDGLTNVMADAAQAAQVVLNLIRNALDSMQSCEAGRGKLTVSTREVNFNGAILGAHVVCDSDTKPGRYASLRISDSGAGISKEALTRVFDPYFSSKGRGHGLGLAAVAGIVRKHGGAISVQSREGDGTTFEVFFPLSPTTGEPLPVSQTREAQAASISVPRPPDESMPGDAPGLNARRAERRT